MKHLSYRGSAFMLFVLVLLVCLMLAPTVGITPSWSVNTTPYRLLNTPQNTWPLIFILALGLICIRFGGEIVQCASSLIFSGVVFGFALISAWYWDSYLSVMLIYSAGSIFFSVLKTLCSLSFSDNRSPADALQQEWLEFFHR